MSSNMQRANAQTHINSIHNTINPHVKGRGTELAASVAFLLTCLFMLSHTDV